MKSDWSHIEAGRSLDGPMGSQPGDNFGAFYIRRGRVDFVIIASPGTEEIPWEHVSARAMDYKGERVPTWGEMCWLKDLFWDEEECVVQYHPPRSDYVNNHPNVLHLWKPVGLELPRPPSIAVGIK
jgi:hypothetical protein